jgi:AraC-like DNA-binding protein
VIFLQIHAAGDTCDFNLRKTLGDSLHRAVRYSTIANEGIALRFRDEADAAMTFTYVGVDRHSDRHQIEFWLTSLVRICRQLTGRHLIPTHAKVVHHREKESLELNTFFGCDVVFGADVDEVAFTGSVQELPVVSGDPYLNELLIKYCEDALSDRQGSRGTLRSELENEIVQLLPHGKTQMGEIARRLGMSTRTLARRLSSEGLTFAGILADLRVDLAKKIWRSLRSHGFSAIRKSAPSRTPSNEGPVRRQKRSA